MAIPARRAPVMTRRRCAVCGGWASAGCPMLDREGTMRRPLAIGCILVVLLSVPAAGAAARSSADTQCFPQTGKCVEGRFLAYWNAHGGLAINGYPLSDERQEKLEDGQYYAVQWF